MQRKVFLQKNMPKGKYSYLKLFLWSAVALIVLVLVTPMLTRHKGDKEPPRKPIPEKSGMLVKEIPKSVPPVVAESLPPLEANPHRGLKETESSIPVAPEAKTAPDVQDQTVPPLEKNIQVDVSPRKAQNTTEAQQKEHAAELALAQPSYGQQVFKDVNAPAKPAAAVAPAVTPKDKPNPPAGKTDRPPLMGPGAKQRGATALASGQKQPQPASGDGALFLNQTAGGADARKKEAKKKDLQKKKVDSEEKKKDSQKKPGDGSSSSYAVQVGSFKEKQNAEEMLHGLQKKGYNVLLKSVSHPKLGELFVVQLQPVPDEGKASTLMMQIKHEEKVRPVLIKLPAGQ